MRRCIINENLHSLFHEAEDHLMLKSVLYGIAPNSMAFVTLTPDSYEDGIMCMINIECLTEESLDDDTIEKISSTTRNHLAQRWDLNSKLSEIGVDPMLLNWWPVSVSSY